MSKIFFRLGLRWCNEGDLIQGKGISICGNTDCGCLDNLNAYEVNMKYNEQGEVKNALVKVFLCAECGEKLNMIHKFLKRKRDKKNKKEMKKRKNISHKLLYVK